jgi:hypothetical protein
MNVLAAGGGAGGPARADAGGSESQEGAGQAENGIGVCCQARVACGEDDEGRWAVEVGEGGHGERAVGQVEGRVEGCFRAEGAMCGQVRECGSVQVMPYFVDGRGVVHEHGSGGV